ncbi:MULTISPECIES: hypothetical protein [Streptomyces]|uniref:Uncharacterized protein n=1 Tax=Streptomyces tsukubensis (strain DSM 42081 / NBRC 108919 / NRRL 18488 / 9993) TaxID=1114943 RepID=I2N118_STRT9|nr:MULTISPECIES: hypothetical protein [Streptomyces]AZK94896.1 hypothetical protein B7R87_14230 [Streptomyces tsukubensis]EIF90715.1 hypothetical protein [Streptomyces tsukubensis NRRL18488]MYS63585.1 hypothetical protein [Streptomyces sp. SID5473]QKM69025.1 hypothetical protein STSU_019545 [Streptomyces tsukubensis NRRL18488]TAI40755.1 hypothetical protein EWI31_30690 [Streptomyces tsukubensis]
MPKHIVQLIHRALKTLFPAHGRHRQTPAPTRMPLTLWMTPWTTPTPAHVLERQRPFNGEDIPLVRPYAPLDTTLQLRLHPGAAS